MKNTRVDIAIATGVLVYALLLMVFSFRYSFEARVFPLMAGAMAVLACGALIASELRGSPLERPAPVSEAATSPSEPPSREDEAAPRPRGGLLVLLVAGSLGLIYLFGAYLYTFLFPVLYVRFFSGLSWRVALAVGVALFAFSYLMFDRFLGVRFDQIGILMG